MKMAEKDGIVELIIIIAQSWRKIPSHKKCSQELQRQRKKKNHWNTHEVRVEFYAPLSR